MAAFKCIPLPELSEKRISVFWSFVDRSGGQDNCWNWAGSLGSGGYGQFCVSRQTPRFCHRIAWTITNGPIPDGLLVLHKCDNRKCVNPHHLFLGTQKDNIRDMMAKGRSRFNINPHRMIGEAHGRAKLTEDKVRQIRKERSSGVPLQVIADQYGMSDRTISQIVRRELWRHVLDDNPH